MKKRVAILIGHRSGAQGAYSPFLKQTEYEYHTGVAMELARLMKGYDLDFYQRPNTPMVSEGYRITQVVNKINKTRYDLVISLHFNAFSSQAAHGCTALHYITNQKTKRIAQEFVDLVYEHFGVKKRPLIAIEGKKQRGGTFITKCAWPSVLVEPFFGSNPEDSYSFLNKEAEYARLLDQLIRNSL